MSTIHNITATEAARGFSDLLHRVHYLHESFVITKGNRPMAYITPSNDVAGSVSLKDLVQRARKKRTKRNRKEEERHDETLRALRRLPVQYRDEPE